MKDVDDLFTERAKASDYLQRLRRGYPQVELPPARQAEARLEGVLAGLAEIPTEVLLDAQALRGFLQEQKATFVLAWAVADLTETLSPERLGRLQSRFAELSVQLALRAAWHQQPLRKLLKVLPEPGADVPGLFVLGLGKLGGEDLNFSSDIDLVAFFDRDSFPVNPAQGHGDVAARALQWVTRFLEDERRDSFLWRVDWRLRPESSVTQLAMSVSAALEYYYFRALPWHRLAMMKARPIAGDLRAGRGFLDDLARFIWRQNLDFRALDELAALKARIDLEHPGLKRQRAQSQMVSEQAEGFNIKLGTGGIREIEFFANALQLVWGGKRPALRVTHTVTALRKLAEQGLVAPELTENFVQSYWWLRRCENRVQLLGNQQTHHIPQDQAMRDRFAQLAGIEDWQSFAGKLYELRRSVQVEFSALFKSAEGEDEAHSGAVPDWPELGQAARDIVDMWEQGFRGYGVPTSQSVGLDQLYTRLCLSILESGLDVEESVRRVHSYFLRLPHGGQYFRLLQNAPRLVDGLILPLLYSPPMRTLLEQTPHIIDALLEQGRSAEVRDEFVFHSADYETRLERMRRLVNEELYLFYLDFLMGKVQPDALQRQLTNLAEHALGAALRVVGEHLGVERPPINILGLGKLGMAKMAPLSDLDILYVCAADQSLESANRYAHRLQTALATPMKEGVVYEMDTRLRPSGRSGPPTISLESFSSYQFERARTWEHQTLVTARAVAGDAQTGAEVMAIRRQVLTRPRDLDQWRMDAARMLMRLREQRIVVASRGIIHAKLRSGGLMETEYLISCAALRFGAQRPDYADLDYEQLVEVLGAELGLSELPVILRFWRVLQLWERLLGLEGVSVDRVPARFSPLMLDQLGLASAAELTQQMDNYGERIRAALDELLGVNDEERAELANWTEQPIIWISSADSQ